MLAAALTSASHLEFVEIHVPDPFLSSNLGNARVRIRTVASGGAQTLRDFRSDLAHSALSSERCVSVKAIHLLFSALHYLKVLSEGTEEETVSCPPPLPCILSLTHFPAHCILAVRTRFRIRLSYFSCVRLLYPQVVAYFPR